MYSAMSIVYTAPSATSKAVPSLILTGALRCVTDVITRSELTVIFSPGCLRSPPTCHATNSKSGSSGTAACGSVNSAPLRTCVSTPSTLTVYVRYTVTENVILISPQESVTCVSPTDAAVTVSLPSATAAATFCVSALSAFTSLP